MEGHFLRMLKNFVKENEIDGTWELHKFRKTFATFYHEDRTSACGRCSCGSGTRAWKPRWPI